MRPATTAITFALKGSNRKKYSAACRKVRAAAYKLTRMANYLRAGAQAPTDYEACDAPLAVIATTATPPGCQREPSRITSFFRGCPPWLLTDNRKGIRPRTPRGS